MSRTSADTTSCGFAPLSTSAPSSPPTPSATARSGPSGRGVKSTSQAPQSTRTRSVWSSQNSRTSAVFPTPASPATSTRRPRPSTASENACCRSSRACSRSSSPGRVRTANPSTSGKCGAFAHRAQARARLVELRAGAPEALPCRRELLEQAVPPCDLPLGDPARHECRRGLGVDHGRRPQVLLGDEGIVMLAEQCLECPSHGR